MANWSQFLDLYCERLTPAFWAEPLNAFSNIFLFLPGAIHLMSFPSIKEKNQKAWLVILCCLAMMVGIGSFLFHTFATYWAMFADVIPITLFMLAFLTWSLRHLLLLNVRWTSLWLTIFLLASFVLQVFLPKSFLNGSGTYLHALAALTLFSWRLKADQPHLCRWMGLAAAIFAVSLCFRSIDMAICPIFPLGVHFIWHTLNGVLLFVCLKTLFLRQRTA